MCGVAWRARRRHNSRVRFITALNELSRIAYNKLYKADPSQYKSPFEAGYVAHVKVMNLAAEVSPQFVKDIMKIYH